MKLRKGKRAQARLGPVRGKGTVPKPRDVRAAARALQAAAELVSRSVHEALRTGGGPPAGPTGGGRRG